MTKTDPNGHITRSPLGPEGPGGPWKKDETFKFISMKIPNINIKAGKMYKLTTGHKDLTTYWQAWRSFRSRESGRSLWSLSKKKKTPKTHGLEDLSFSNG